VNLGWYSELKELNQDTSARTFTVPNCGDYGFALEGISIFLFDSDYVHHNDSAEEYASPWARNLSQ